MFTAGIPVENNTKTIFMKFHQKPFMALCTACAFLLFFSSCSKDIPGGSSSGGGIPGSTGDDFQPQSPEILAPYVGVWENDDESVVFLNNGHIAIADRTGRSLPYEVGTYHVNDDQSITIEMIFTGHDVHITSFDNGELTFGIQNLTHTGAATDAPQVYNLIY